MILKTSFLVFALLMGVTLALDLERVLSQAITDLEDDSIEVPKASREIKKVTVHSRAMAKRGSLFRKMVNGLKDQGMQPEESKSLARRVIHKMKGSFAVAGMKGLTRPVQMVDNVCMRVPVSCNPSSPWRTFTGLCNNLKDPYQGATSTKFARDIPLTEEFNPDLDFSIYLDASGARLRDGEELNYRGLSLGIGLGGASAEGVSFPIFINAKGVSLGKNKCPSRRDLPGARLISTTFHGDQNIPSDRITTMVMQFGQFLDHDTDLTAEYEAQSCCQGPFDPEDDCLPIQVSRNDPFYGPRNVTCLEFVRSVDFCEENGGPKELANAITHYIDGSNIYGSDETVASQLRSFQKGEMLMGPNRLLPRVDDREIAGDTRALEMPGLASMHTLWVREHNRVAGEIYKLHPEWTDEVIFQHARRIVLAEYQNVVYGEFVPILVGPNSLGGLELPAEGSLYNPLVDASITNEFATSSFRFGHSLLNPTVERFALDNSGKVSEFRLRDNFNNIPTYRADNGLAVDQILFGLVNQKAQSTDRLFSQAVTNNLFPMPGRDFGQDLIARNIQRGRDHGLAGFCCYYKIFVDPRFNCNSDWDKRYKGIPQESWDILRTIYKRPSDIDLFTGTFAQLATNGALTGEVGTKMNAKVFLQAKFGDRFFFTHRGQAGSFTTAGRTQILRRTMSSILCDNIGVQKVPLNAFIQTSPSAFVPCSTLPKLDNFHELFKIEAP